VQASLAFLLGGIMRPFQTRRRLDGSLEGREAFLFVGDPRKDAACGKPGDAKRYQTRTFSEESESGNLRTQDSVGKFVECDQQDGNDYCDAADDVDPLLEPWPVDVLCSGRVDGTHSKSTRA
jgi:hypothetical protein